MKQFISDIKILNKSSRLVKDFIVHQAIVTIFSLSLAFGLNYYLYLMLILVMPSLYLFSYFRFYKSQLREIEKEIDLNLKYDFINNRFNRVN